MTVCVFPMMAAHIMGVLPMVPRALMSAPACSRMSMISLCPPKAAQVMALKAALYSALRARNMTVADLARRLDTDDRKAARLIDPRAASRLTSLEAALSALGYAIAIEVHEKPAA